jgi:hypothetical protein
MGPTDRTRLIEFQRANDHSCTYIHVAIDRFLAKLMETSGNWWRWWELNPRYGKD